jgi:hypothetical protein
MGVDLWRVAKIRMATVRGVRLVAGIFPKIKATSHLDCVPIIRSLVGVFFATAVFLNLTLGLPPSVVPGFVGETRLVAKFLETLKMRGLKKFQISKLSNVLKFDVPLELAGLPRVSADLLALKN